MVRHGLLWREGFLAILRFQRLCLLLLLTALAAATGACERSPAPQEASGAAPEPSPAPSTVSPPRPKPELFPLAPGTGQPRRLAAGQLHVYRIDLGPDEYLDATFEQSGVDLMIEVFAPGTGRLYKVDSPNRDQGPEDVHLVATAPGAYRFEITTTDDATDDAAPGAYTPKLRAVRTPTETDRSQAAGDMAFYQAKEIESAPARFWETVAKYERSIRLFQEAGDRFHEAYAYLRLARVQARPTGKREALELFIRAEKRFREIGAVHFLILALNDQGRCAQDLGDFERAEAAFRNAVELAGRSSDIWDQAGSHHNLGNLLQSQGRSWEALGHLREALALWRQAGVEARANEAEVLTSIGWTYQSTGDWQRALDAHDRALRLRNGVGDPGLRSVSLTQIGSIWLSLDPRRALPYLERARALQQGPPGGREAATLAGLGVAYRQLGLHGQAQSAYRRALDLYTTPPDLGGQGIVWTNLGWVALELNQPAEARRRFEKGLRLARQTRNPMAEARAFLGLADAESRRGNDILAQRRAEESLAIVESQRSAIPRADLQTTYLAANESPYDLLIRILMERHRRQPGGGFDLQALSRSEQSRARGLIDALRESRQAEEAAPSAPPELLARRRSLLEEVGVIDGRRRRPDLAPAEISAAERELAEALDRLSEVEASIRRHRLGQGPQAPPPDSLEAHRAALLEPDTLLLQYHLGDRRSYLWAVSATGVQSFELPGLESLEPLLRATYAELSGTSGPGGPEASRGLELSRILLGPLAGHLRGKRLLIAADGLQRSIPFAALPSPVGSHQPLLLENEVVSIPSLTVAAELRDRSARRQPPPGALKIWADPVFDASDERLARTPAPRERDENGDEFLPRLILSRDEAAAIAKLLPGRQPPIALDFEASRDLVLADNLSDYRILHFATHGILRTDHPALSSLVLSRFDPLGNPRNGYLRVSDIAGLRLRADLVVLSACETAFGREASDAETIGLPEAFLNAGARRVLASLWHVEEESTAALMERFYQHLLDDGLPAAQALREAQLAIRAQPRWSAPRYWAGFVLLGDWK
ncbi:MAG TPA: CHAT domain-containing tetratricopeptide repeat protein [Thermoanaerobaculia bacterium]